MNISLDYMGMDPYESSFLYSHIVYMIAGFSLKNMDYAHLHITIKIASTLHV